jgi:thiol-disulfide isomerase/thioredoxin
MPIFVRALAALAFAILAAPVAAVQVGAPAPSLPMPLMDDSGKSVRMSQFRGKVVYVDFWASWCIPCRISMPSLDRLYKQHVARGFEVVGVNKDVRTEDAERFLKRVPVSFVLVGDSSDAAAKAFAVKTMPSGYLVDRKGVVRHVHGGYTKSTSDELATQVEKLLAEAP